MKKLKKLPANMACGLFFGVATLSGLDAQAQNPRGFAIEEITVTARKVEEKLQEVPISISAFTGDGLERRQITGTDDIGRVTPNLEFVNNAPLAGNNSSSQIFIRGIGQVSGRANVDPGVGLYIDDVYIGQSVGGTMELRDIAGVQILRGPQGTLFGRNTVGGAVLLTTVEPGDQADIKARVNFGTDSLREFFGAANLPISENLKTRFTFGSKQHDGYVTRTSDNTDLGDINNYTFTSKALYTPVDALTVKLNFDYTGTDENGNPLVFAAAAPSTSAPTNIPAIGANQSVLAGCPGARPPGPPPGESIPQDLDDSRCFNDFQNAGPYANNGTFPLESSLENWGFSLNLAYEINNEITLKSITSYRDLSWTGKRDADNTSLDILHTDYDSDGDQFSQEFQFLYDSSNLTGAVGLYYYQEEVEDILTVTVGAAPPPAQRPAGLNPNLPFYLDSDNNITDNENYAVFTQWSYDIMERLNGTLGARYTKETKGSTPDQFLYFFLERDGEITDATRHLPKRLYEQDFNATTLSASLSYRWNDAFMSYFSYAEGFKSGGWNSSFNFPLSPEALAAYHQFDQEEAKTYEIGFKSDLLDNTLRLNVAVFHTDYTDLQFIYRLAIAPTLLNAGEATIQGAELELTWVPDEAWIVEAGLGLLDSSIDSVRDFPSLGGVDVNTSVNTSNRLPYTPEFQGNLGIGYTANVNTIAISPRIDVAYRAETFFDTANTVEIAQTGGVTTVDASVSFEPHDQQWKVVAGVNNATDKTYPIAGNSSLPTGTGYAEIAYSRPRYYFVGLTYDF